MKNTFLRGLVLAGALCGAALPVGAPAQDQVVPETNFLAHFTSVYGSQFPYEGTLQLHLNPDGIVTGYYRPADNMEFVPVTGGRDGDRIWFDIGQTNSTHVDAKLHDGKMTGTAIDSNNEQLDFNASDTSR